MPRDIQKKIKDIKLTGRLITSTDGVFIGEHFSEIKNIRYKNFGLEGVGGMSKINSTALSSHPKLLNGFHFKKDKPSESHTLVQAWNTGLTSSVVYQNETAIPGVGDFNATVLHTDESGASVGRFGNSPNGEVVYCNGKESLMWGGDEFTVSKFINYDPGGSFRYDFSTEVSNSLDNNNNIARLEGQSGGNTIDTVLLLNLDNNVIDTSTGGATHIITNNNVTFSSGTKVFGTHAAELNGSNAYFTTPTHTDFDFSDGTFTIDGRVYASSLSSIRPIYYHGTDSERYMSFYVNTDGSICCDVYNSPTTAWVGTTAITLNDAVVPVTPNGFFYECTSAGTTAASEPTWPTVIGDTVVDGSVTWTCRKVLDLSFCTAVNTIQDLSWSHIELSENGNDWYIFVNGILKGHTSNAGRTISYKSDILIGHNGSTYFHGFIDELRISTSNQHSSNFEISTNAYSTLTSISYMYVGSLRPIRGFKYYLKTANSTTSTMGVEYWDGSSWTNVTSLTDNTSSGGVSLAQTGSVSFDSTSVVAKASIIDQTYIFWYKVTVSSVDAGTSLSQVTIDSPMQDIQDIWDGSFRAALKFFKYNGSTFIDNSINVFSENYSSADTATYSQVGGTTSGQYLLIGFAERISALNINFVDDEVNSTTSILDLSYWNGSSWAQVTGLNDGTISSGKSFAKTGTISWQSPTSSTEFKQEISKEIPLYYYQIKFSATISSSVFIDTISGIPAQVDVNGYNFPMSAQDRLWLCSDPAGDKNVAICSARGTSVVFNGEDSISINFGDSTELTAATNLYSQFSSSLYDLMVFCKKHETWLVSGSGPQDWTKFLASDKIGCVAPLTMVRAHVGIETVPGLNRYIAIWQSDDGIYLFDGRNFHPIHLDIEDLFDKKNIDGLNTDVLSKSVGYYDDYYSEYHWLCATGVSTTLNREFVYDLRKQRWFEIDRGTGKYLQMSITLQDVSGNKYIYGGINSGYIERLENGTTFDGDDIIHTFTIGDLNLTNSVFLTSGLRGVRLIAKTKNTTSNKVTLNYYIDGKSIPRKSFTDIDVDSSSSSVTYSKKDTGGKFGIHHSLKFSLTTNDETYGFEPYIIGLMYKVNGLDIS